MTERRQAILPPGRRAGVCIHMTSLPGPHGIGDIANSSLSFIDTMAEMCLGVWQFLPTGPTAYGDSPYQPLSAFAGNEMLIGLDPLIDHGLLRPNEAASLTGLPADFVDYGTLIPGKAALLSKAADRMMSSANGELKADFDNFLHLNDTSWLNDYALFRILKTQHGERPWPEWETSFVHREADAMQWVADRFHDEIQRVKVLQFLFDRQWQRLRRHAAEKGILLFADIPIYIALDSSDAWAHPEILRVDRDGRPSHVAGVPPDYFSEDGQLWGNPLYDWDYHAETGYAWWIERLQHTSGMADLVRIDHFRGFEAYWSVPFGAGTARTGEWITGPGDALFQAMSRALGHLPIVAEDLGVITDKVVELRLNHDMPGMKVLQFEIGEEDFDIDEIEENCVCYTGTHDNDTTLGWFRGTGEDTRTEEEVLDNQQLALNLTGGSPETIHADMIRYAFSSPASLAIAPMQDFLGLGSESRLNIPSTTSNNWRWRMQSEQVTPAFVESVAALVRESGRDISIPERG